MADRNVTVNLRADISQYQRQLAAAAASTNAFGRSTSGAGKEIDKLSGRLRLMTDLAVIGAPALTAMGAAGVGGMVALSAQLGATAGALGVTILAVKGLGDGLKALDAYQLDPTTANLKKLNQEMEKLGPAGEHFVRFLDSIEPDLKSLQFAARDGLLPGAEEGIDALLQRLPELRSLISGIATELGDLSAGAGKTIAGPKFDAFFEYLRTDGIPLLDSTAKTAGNLAEVVANLFVAFGGVSSNFSGGLLKFSQGLADASENLDSNEGFQKFLHFIETEGPHALQALEAIADALLQIVEATAPLSGPVLTGVTAFAKAIAAIADSDLGTPIFAGIAALAIYNRSLALTAKLQTSVAAFSPWTLAVVAGTAAVVEFTSANDDLAGSLDSIDTARASGSVDSYAASIDTAQKALDDFRAKQTEEHNPLIDNLPFGVGGLTHLDQISSWYHEFNGDNDEAQKKIDAARKSLQSFADGSVISPINAISNAISDAAKSAQEEADALQAATDAMKSQRQEALRALDAQLNYQAAIDDANKAVKENGKQFDITTEKGRANRQALYALADGWNQQSKAAKNAKGSLEDARKNFITTAEQMGATADQAKRLADRLFEIPPKRKTEIELAGADDAISKAKTLSQILAGLHSKSINIALNYQTGGNKRPDIPLPGGTGADGMTVPGPRHPYGDKMMILAAPGERVISNRYGQADRHSGVLDAINADRFADGGRVGGGSFTLSANASQGGVGDQMFTDGVYSAAKALKALKAELEAATKSLDKERQTRDDLQSQFDSIKSSVGGAYSTMDPFAAASGSVWSKQNPLGAFDAAVAGNTANTQAAQTALAFAQSHGLDGPLYAALAASGNLPLLQAFANLSSAEIDQREQAFAAQSNAQAALGGMAANAEVGSQLRDANKELAGIRREVRELRQDVKQADHNNQQGHKQNAKDVADGVNGAASNGHRRRR